MPKGLNLCQFIGRLGIDPEIKYLPSGDAVVNFSIAVNSEWKDKATGDKREHTEWVMCDAYGGIAEVIGKYLGKGSHVYVSGELKTRKWADYNGVDRYKTSLVVRDMQMLGAKGQGSPEQQNQPPEGMSPAQQHSNQESFNDMDDDIPF